MSDMRIYMLAGVFLIGAAGSSVAGEGGDGKENGATQRSIYEVARGDYPEGYNAPVVMEGRSAAIEALPSEDEALRRQRAQESFYTRNESRTAD